MTAEAASPFVGRGLRSLSSRFRSRFRLLSTSSSIRAGAANPVISYLKPSFQASSFQREARSSFHSASRRPALPSRGATFPVFFHPQQQVLQQQSRLGRGRPWIECGSPRLRRGRHSYRRFDDEEFDTRGYWRTQLVLFWRSYRYFIMAGGGAGVVFYVTHLEETPVRINPPPPIAIREIWGSLD